MLKPPNGCAPTQRARALAVEVQVADEELVARAIELRCRLREYTAPVNPNSVLFAIAQRVLVVVAP